MGGLSRGACGIARLRALIIVVAASRPGGAIVHINCEHTSDVFPWRVTLMRVQLNGGPSPCLNWPHGI